MFEIYGSGTRAKVFSDFAEPDAVSQIQELCNQSFTAGETVRIMPDVHSGAGCTIGTTMTITDKIVPNLVGVDIGCGMETIVLKERFIEPQKLDKLIREKIPSGFAIQKKAHRFAKQIDLTALFCAKQVNLLRAEQSIGTLGGGNHFIEVDKGSDGTLYLVIHSGSRHLGVETAKYYQREAYRRLQRNAETQQEMIAEMKRQGREQEIQETLKLLKRERVPKHFAYCEGELFEQYLHDMKIVQEYASLNRRAMADTIVREMHWHIVEQFSTIHNYIDMEHRILRKGAVSAQAGERLLIPINMRDGSLLCTGKGNPDWNFSAPHGAGRILSRSEAKSRCSIAEYRKAMEGIYTTSVGMSTLDECPMAYKGMEEIVKHIGETAEIVDTIRPIYNFKAGEE